MLFKRNSKRKISPKMQKRFATKAPSVTVMQPLQCDLRFSGAKHNTSTTQPQQREAFKQPPDYDLQRLRGKTHYSKASTTKNKKSPGSLTSNASAIQNSFNSKTRRASEPTFLRNETSVYPKKSKKNHCFVQILTSKNSALV